MSKELIISSTAHETKVAILEDDLVAEVYFEREQEHSVAGSVYKGRVTRVLPGMQSAFVDIGLDRDAFLYVSDFFEDTDEYDRVVTSAEEKVAKLEQERAVAEAPQAPVSPAAPAEAPAAAVEPAAEPAREAAEGGGKRRRRRRRGRGKGFPESKYAGVPASAPERAEAPVAAAAEPSPQPAEPTAREPMVLPGESLAKYRERQPAASATEASITPEPSEEVRSGGFTPPPTVSPEAAATPAQEVAPPEPCALEAAPIPAEQPQQEAPEPEAPEASESGSGAAAEEAEPAPGDEPTSEAPPVPVTEAASVREPAGTPRYSRTLSRRMRRRMMREQRFEKRQEKPPSGRTNGGARPAYSQPLIADLLREGQEIIVQIAKEPLGKKGARITSHIALPGRYLVYMPTVDHIGVSRRIASEDERLRLKRLLSDYRRSADMPGGFIVRTAAEGHSEQDLRNDVQFLFNLWREMRATAERSSAPALLHRDLNLVERILRDQLSGSFSTIWVDNEAEYTKILEFVQNFQPSLVGRIKLYLKDTPIFEEFGIQEELNKALKPKVWLKSGGYIVINQTEALVAIDVNTGKYVGRTQRLEDTIVKTNVDAIKEIVRQIRLRDLGGIIVIDFIDMDERKNRQRVMQALEEALRQDRAPSKALAFNDFGLVAITRKRVKQPLERTLGCACPYCSGAGFVKNPQTVSMEILEEVKKMLSTLERPAITLRVNPEVARYLKQRDVTIVQEIEEMAKKTVIIKSDPLLHQENFDIH